jgi:hypothetical protein
MADNSLLISKYFQAILEESTEVADILDPEHAPHTPPEPEVTPEDTVFTLNDVEGETGEQGGDTGESEPTYDYTQRIFPLLQPDTLAFPFIVHSRTGISVTYTKDLPLGWGWTNTVNYTVSCVSDDYVQCIELANAVRHALEGYQWKDEDIYIHPIQLLTVSEYTTDNDAFVEELQFQCIVE